MNTKEEYLTKRIVLRAARKGMKAASKSTMKVMGYNVIAQNGWVVKKFRNGRIEKIKRINNYTNLGPVALD